MTIAAIAELRLMNGLTKTHGAAPEAERIDAHSIFSWTCASALLSACEKRVRILRIMRKTLGLGQWPKSPT